MAEVWVAAIGVAVSAASVGYSMSGAGMPAQPDLAASSAQLSNVNARLLPIRRMLESAAQQGTKVTLPNSFDTVTVTPASYSYKGKPVSEAQAKQLMATPQTAKQVQFTQAVTKRVPRVVDFSGLGTADVQSKIASEMAKAQLDLNDKYGGQFIDQALAQEKEADPQGFAAREKENELIQKQIADKPERPVAKELEKQIGSEVDAANQGKLDPEMHGVLDDAVGKALAARGGKSAGINGAPVDFEKPLTTGFAGEQRESQAAQKGMSLLSSGATEEDTDFRRELQNLSNLSALVNGRTPQSQFSNLSAASQGPVKMNPGQPLGTMPTNTTGAQGVANSNWMTGIGQALNQVNPATFAMSTLAGAGQIAAGAGWKPFANNQQN